MFWQLLLVTAAVGAAYYHLSRRRLYRLARQTPSGLKAYPIIGHAYLFTGSYEDLMLSLQKIGQTTYQHGGLASFWLANRLFVSMTNPTAIEVVAKACLDKDETTLRCTRMVIGNGLIFAPVNIWHRRRKIMAPFFALKNLHHIVPLFNEKSSIMVDLMRAEVGAGDFPIWKYMTTYSFDTVCETAAAHKMNSQEDPADRIFLDSINEGLEMVTKRVLLPWLHPDFIYKKLPVYKELMGHLRRAYDFIDEIVLEKRKQMATNGIKDKNNNSSGLTNFLEMIIQTSGGLEKGYSNLEIREEAIVMIVAGNDTSAVGGSFTAVLLSRYPDVQAKVHQELDEVFGDSNRPVTPEDLPRLKYLEAVIKESLRLYPPVPIVAREVRSDVELPSGTTLVDGTSIMIHIWGTHRDPAYWGADAEEFRPERFLEGPLRHPAMFIPFSYSIRGCIGGTYAMMSAKTALANLLRRYRLLPPAGVRDEDLRRPLSVKYNIMMKASDDFLLRVQERKIKSHA
ncbi:cytochrome P450 4V2-like, partial [Leguminivora glycinivorella]|uniref:cytochrome P450 4V2-like n=1 Tax=Leguminivora glycinivorella TaxID=1035111 RepID=UPI00200E143F